jgi:shikimate 5-dehydrogenase
MVTQTCCRFTFGWIIYNQVVNIEKHRLRKLQRLEEGKMPKTKRIQRKEDANENEVKVVVLTVPMSKHPLYVKTSPSPGQNVPKFAMFVLILPK